MVTKTNLGRLTPVQLRECWEREDADFTPWLAKPENIEVLSQAIRMDLEVQGEEAAVGSFRADVLCRDAASGDLVVIENQLERTDHTHLGQTLTYAAGLDAVTVIWIAERFTEEHRAALDWLNRITHESFRFFGIQIELWRIGESQPAPKFNVVAMPNDWAKTAKETAGAASQARTDAQVFWYEYWKAFAEFMRESGSKLTLPKPKTSHWTGWGIGGRGAALCGGGSQRDGHVEVWVNLGGPNAKAVYHLLVRQRREIEAELGFSMDWNERADLVESTIMVQKQLDMRDEDRWPELFRWKLDKLEKVKAVFYPRISQLNPDDWKPEESSE